jgi:hypothetical protein
VPAERGSAWALDFDPECGQVLAREEPTLLLVIRRNPRGYVTPIEGVPDRG